jgi:hypothetical protein
MRNLGSRGYRNGQGLKRGLPGSLPTCKLPPRLASLINGQGGQVIIIYSNMDKFLT